MKLAGRKVAATLAVVVGLTACGVAVADPNDDLYLKILKSHVAGITNTEGDAGLIKGGHIICDRLRQGYPRGEISRKFTQGHGWSDSDAAWVITASAVAYCPEYVLPSDRW